MPSVTLSQLQSRVLDRLENNSGFYPVENIRLVLNQGLARLNLLTGFNRGMVTVSGGTQAGKLVYATPSGISVPLTLYCDNRMLEPATLPELSRRYRKWAQESTSNIGPVSRWARIGLKSFVIHPQDPVGGRVLLMEGIVPVTKLTTSGQVVSLDDQYVDLLVEYAVGRAQLKEQGAPFDRSSVYHQKFVSSIKEISMFQGLKFPPYWILKRDGDADRTNS